jgi:Spore Coat Protein U domain
MAMIQFGTQKQLAVNQGGNKMKKLLAITVAVAVVSMAGSAMAAGDTNTLTVSASVTGTCKFNAPKTSALTFPALDPSVNAPVTGTTTTTYWCTKGVTTDAITADNGANFTAGKRQMKDPVSTELIPYTLTLTKDGVANGGPTVPRTLTIDGGILFADFSAKSSGTYTDTVVLNILP